jgi:hypothetical protein
MQSGFNIKETNMSFWLIVYLFTADGEYFAKDVYETGSAEQCVEFAGQVTKTIVNTSLQAQFHCVSDDHYMGRKQDEGIEYD